MRRLLIPILLLIISTWGPRFVLSQTGQDRSIHDGVYTEAQARRGGAVMTDACGTCHMDEQFGGTFIQSWSGATVADLFEAVSTQMPEDRPGTLEAREYVDILAYIFWLNGAPSGPDELRPTIPNLEKIRIEWRP